MNIALIAHNNKKRLMENFCLAYSHILAKHTLFATGTTGSLVEASTNLPINKYLAGHLGGLEQLGAQISSNDIDLVIFLRDPQSTNEPSINTMLYLCDTYNIPLASNLATAEILIHGLDSGSLDWRNMAR